MDPNKSYHSWSNKSVYPLPSSKIEALPVNEILCKYPGYLLR